MHAWKDYDVTVRHARKPNHRRGIHAAEGASRTTTLTNGDDKLDIRMGDRDVTILMGSQSTSHAVHHTRWE